MKIQKYKNCIGIDWFWQTKGKFFIEAEFYFEWFMYFYNFSFCYFLHIEYFAVSCCCFIIITNQSSFLLSLIMNNCLPLLLQITSWSYFCVSSYCPVLYWKRSRSVSKIQSRVLSHTQCLSYVCLCCYIVRCAIAVI